MIIILRQDGWQNWGWERFKGWRAWSSEQPGYDQSHLACVPFILENQKSVRSQNPRKGKKDQKATRRGRSPRKTVAPAILTLNRSNPTFSSQKFWGNSKRQVRQAIAGNPASQIIDSKKQTFWSVCAKLYHAVCCNFDTFSTGASLPRVIVWWRRIMARDWRIWAQLHNSHKIYHGSLAQVFIFLALQNCPSLLLGAQ